MHASPRSAGRRSSGLAARVHDGWRVGVALAVLASGVACASAPVEQATHQTRAGVQAADLGYWEEAEFRWMKSLAIEAGDARALNNLAVRFERAGEFDKAKEYYERALKAATPSERFYIERNQHQFLPIWERVKSEQPGAEATGTQTSADGTSGQGAEPAVDGDQTPPGDIHAVEILVAVPDEGPNLAGYKRILVGNFVKRSGSEANLNDFAVRYFRRRITQRTFFETRDALDHQNDDELRVPAVLDNTVYWVRTANSAGADLVLTGAIGLNTRQESRMVRERIRTPDGEIREVARFQDSTVYHVDFDYRVLRGEDGKVLLSGSLQAEQVFPAEDNIDRSQAVFETLEELLPDLLDNITPQRSEQSRYLIY